MKVCDLSLTPAEKEAVLELPYGAGKIQNYFEEAYRCFNIVI